jgi:hypothetical protein
VLAVVMPYSNTLAMQAHLSCIDDNLRPGQACGCGDGSRGLAYDEQIGD